MTLWVFEPHRNARQRLWPEYELSESGDKESPAWVLPKATTGSEDLTLNTSVCMLGSVWSVDDLSLCLHERRLVRYMPAEVHLGMYTFACREHLPRGRVSWPLIIHQHGPYMSIPEPLSLQILIHYWEAAPEENQRGSSMHSLHGQLH